MSESVDRIIRHCVNTDIDTLSKMTAKDKNDIRKCVVEEADKKDLGIFKKWELRAKLKDIEARALEHLDRINPKAALQQRLTKWGENDPGGKAFADGAINTMDKFKKGDVSGAAMAAATTAWRSSKPGQMLDALENGELPGKGRGRRHHKGNSDKKTTDKKKGDEDNVHVEGTPSHCKKIKIKVDGSDYPTDKAPKPELRSHTEEWTVSTESREECKQRLTKIGQRDGTDEYQKIVSNDISSKKGLPQGHKDYLTNEFGSEMGNAVDNRDGAGAIKIVTQKNQAIDNAASGTRAGSTNKHNYHHIRPRWAHGHLGNVGGNESGNLTPSPVRHQTKEGIHGWWDDKLNKAGGSVKRQLSKCPKIKKCKSKMNPKLTECNVTKLAKCIKRSSKGKSKLVVVYKG